MPSITITITDLADAEIRVTTDAQAPTVGTAVSPAQAIAMELLGIAFKRGCFVVYDAKRVPAIALALELLDPEGLGFAVTPEVRDRARVVLGRPGAERRQPMQGVDIDRVHSKRPAV
ncbi:MAG: hypothetical protein J7605_02670 [Variovorax sp.]|nr:hypothetical protein [Variovorax sp.]